jgi:hypothetical protein
MSKKSFYELLLKQGELWVLELYWFILYELIQEEIAPQ